MVTQVIGPGLSALLMKRNPWIPMLLGLGLQSLVILMVLALPETKDYHTPSPQPEPAGDSPEPLSPTPSTTSTKSTHLQRMVRAGKDSITFLASDKRILLIIPGFCLHLLLSNRDILLQYISARYAKTLSYATYLISIRSVFMLVFLLLLFPTISNLLRTTYAFHPQRSDLLLSRISSIVMALGFFFIALAPSIPLLIGAMVVNTLGGGTHLFLRSLATSLVEPHHVARLNTFVSWFDLVGIMLGSPIMAWLFEVGVDKGAAWIGLPFLFCSACMALIAIMLSMISLGHEQLSDTNVGMVGEDGDEEEEEGEYRD